MGKYVLPGLLVFILLLSACSPQATAVVPSGTVKPAVTVGSTAAAPKAGDCTLTKAGYPTAGATEASLFLPITRSDWSLGKEGAPVTIIEYSDFQ